MHVLSVVSQCLYFFSTKKGELFENGGDDLAES